ncbi:hypothetical protein RCC89_07855 [Cytophagaceae bacterium ABcell3]|nr:hypothetical protein RCC89_07855 [Cytophagaceae bacterium ABcell3]
MTQIHVTGPGINETRLLSGLLILKRRYFMESTKMKEMDYVQHEFIKTLLSDFGPLEINEQIENWYKMDWPDFKHELNKQNISLDGSTTRDWREYFKLQKIKMDHILEH